ncbi:SLATT domain-containing protein [Oribacterium sp. oral taxon 078]|uniref:SLATT domain-containing protein n=1 Tax=Oribacterium sp. oral taxon 078 TaxID=652706 RepID=UPI002E8DDC9E|nr:SLATT domain-containing protein [Oribacterium sp. oral taxon 078]
MTVTNQLAAPSWGSLPQDGGYAAKIPVSLCPDSRFPVLRTGGFTAPVYPGISAVLSLCLNLYAKEYKIQNEVSQHRNAANMLWDIRESYVSLLVDFEVLEDNEIQKRRDILCEKVSEVNNNYPATDVKSYKAAQRALKDEEEQTFKDNEVDSILPNGIDK